MLARDATGIDEPVRPRKELQGRAGGDFPEQGRMIDGDVAVGEPRAPARDASGIQAHVALWMEGGVVDQDEMRRVPDGISFDRLDERSERRVVEGRVDVGA